MRLTAIRLSSRWRSWPTSRLAVRATRAHYSTIDDKIAKQFPDSYPRSWTDPFDIDMDDFPEDEPSELQAEGSSEAQRALRTHATVEPPLVLALDADETLWRSRIEGQTDHVKLSSVDIHLEIDFGRETFSEAEAVTAAPTPMSQQRRQSRNFGPTQCLVSLRPGLHEFLDWIRQRRSEGSIGGPWIFTQGSKTYIRAVLSKVDPTGDIFGERVLSRDCCTRMGKPWPWVHKELAHLQRCSKDVCITPEQIVLVENNVMSVLMHPENAVLVRDWRGDGKPDVELHRVSAIIDAVLAKRTGQAGNYAALLAGAPGHKEFKEELGELHERVKRGVPEGKNPNVVLQEVWKDALKAKMRFLVRQQSILP